jgi:hypothetical protein
VERLAELDEGRRREAVGLEAGEELASVGRELCGVGLALVHVLHGKEDGGVVVAEVVVFLWVVEGRGEAGLVREGVGWEEHDVGELRGQADLADALDDLVEARREDWQRGLLLLLGGGGRRGCVVGVRLEQGRLEPEARAGA